MKIRVNLDIIRRLLPCEDRLENYVQHYSEFDGDILEFLELTEITFYDKVWVFCHLVPKDLARMFVIDSALLTVFVSETSFDEKLEDLAESASRSAAAAILYRRSSHITTAATRSAFRLLEAYASINPYQYDLHRSCEFMLLASMKYLVSTTTKKELACLA